MPLYAATLDPESAYAALRAEWGSVAAVELSDGVPAWLALDWTDALRVVREPNNFTREVRHWRAFQNGQVKPGTGLHAFFSDRDNAYYSDGADHTRRRAVVDDAFARVDESALRRDVQWVCDRMLAHIVRDGATTADLVPTYTQFVPSLAVAAMYGLGADDAGVMGQYARDIFSNTAAAGPAFVGLNAMLEDLIRERSTNPGHDVLSTMVRWRDPRTGTGLTDKELLDTAQMIQSAGHEMSVAWVTMTLVHLLSDTDFDGRVRGGRLGIDEALDSVLVNSSPVWNTPARFATADIEIGSVFNEHNIEIGGRIVHEGEAIVAAAAEATASVHRNADPVWTGTSRASLAFGASGPHHCPAQRISRIIVKASIEAVLHRLPGLKLTVPPDQLGTSLSLWARSVSSLPVSFDPVTGYDENWTGTEASLR
ncbi:hypothetical protein [Promicromonospora iranensis]|uniref:Cytochrome P450 n=1 Tax=Promicromonospora iranensis TaxID=1105144 RepID=A0ABU2CIL1_9MICO|nr:hypothetical protein [Promicromonospora iranensis]MDR7381164.1 cytochrome P450 [Promicromonospora iranensis]